MTLPEDLPQQILVFCRAHTGDPDARVFNVEVMPGHAGFSYGFTVEYAAGGATRRESFVMRLPPPGVRYEGPADVLRQARLLRALAETAVPVPRVRWWGDDERWFGRPYYIVERLPGNTLRMPEDGSPPPSFPPGALQRMGRQAVEALVALHRLDWQQHVPEWGPPLHPALDVMRWDRFWERSADVELVKLGPEVKRKLLERIPKQPRVGIFHGDFQWTNLLYDGERLTAVLDWELAGVGAVLNDLGWLMVFSDPQSWSGQVRLPTPGAEEIQAMYVDAWGADPGDVSWYRALAGYKFSIIAGFNLMLHRRGKRVDPHYEILLPSIPRLMERANEVLDGRA